MGDMTTEKETDASGESEEQRLSKSARNGRLLRCRNWG